MTLPDEVLARYGPERAEAVRAIHEGYLLHYDPPADRAADLDLALLDGDRLYALGLERLAAAGDLAGVRAMAQVITLCAEAHAADDPRRATVAWQQGASSFSR